MTEMSQVIEILSINYNVGAWEMLLKWFILSLGGLEVVESVRVDNCRLLVYCTNGDYDCVCVCVFWFDVMGDKAGSYNPYLCLVAICDIYICFGQMLKCLINGLLWFYFIQNWFKKWANPKFNVNSNATKCKREPVRTPDQSVKCLWLECEY